jgi:ribose transport system permease protein
VSVEPTATALAAEQTPRPAFLPRGLPSWRTAGILLPFLTLFVVLSIASGPFFSKTNLLNILDQQSATLIMAGAGTLVLISGGIDLSVGANYALCGVVAGEILQHHSTGLAIVAAIFVGVAAGLANGVITTYFRINALIATLAMSFILSGLASKVTGGNLLVLSNKPGFANLARAHFLTAPTSIWIALACLVVLGVVLSRTTVGRYMYAVGGNAEASRLAGVRVNWVRIAAFTASGAAAAIGGLIDTSRVLSAQSSSGDQLAFTVLAGIVVGGTSILGGEGAIWRTVLGVLFIALVGNGFDLLGVDPLYQQITLGVILLVAVGVDAWARTDRR